MRTKKIKFLLLLPLLIFLLGGIFMEVKNIEAYKCMVVDSSDPCNLTEVMQKGCNWKDASGDSCTSGQYACAGGKSFSNIAVCLIDDLHLRKCDTSKACFTDGSPIISPPPIKTLGAYQYCLEDKCPAAAGASNGAVCRVTVDDNTNLATGIYPPFAAGESVTGVWDSSDGKCVRCNVLNREMDNCGDSGGTYFDGANCTGLNDAMFESACGADSACDSVTNVGDSCTVGSACESRSDTCVAGNTCNTNGKCVATVIPDCINTDRSVANATVPCKCGTAAIANTTNDFCCAADSGGAGSVYSNSGICPAVGCTCGNDCCLLGCPAGDPDCACAAQGGTICIIGQTCPGTSLNHNAGGVCCDVPCVGGGGGGGGSGGTGHGNYFKYDKDIKLVFTEGAEFLLRIAGGLALLVLVLGGVYYIISGASPEGQTKAKKVVTYAVIGIVIVLVAYVIVAVVENIAV